MWSISPRRLALLLAVPVIMIAGAVFLTGRVQRDAALLGAKRQTTSQNMLTAMLDQETGARGLFLTRQRIFLEPWEQGRVAFATGVVDMRSLVAGDPALTRMLALQERQGLRWHRATERRIAKLEQSGRSGSVDIALQGKSLMDAYRAGHAAFDVQLAGRRATSMTTASAIAVGLVAALVIALVGIALRLTRRLARTADVHQRDQSELRELLQVSETEQESRILLIRHVERLLPEVRAAVFNRNNSDDRLEITRGGSTAASALDGVDPESLRPRSCMAVRLSRPFGHDRGSDALSTCEICGDMPGKSACEPLLVGGQVIGSVLVVSKASIGSNDRVRVRESVSQAAPILANQRNLKIAETRAASDALTGLPNRRAADDTLKRMAAHAGRSASSLAAILLDIDYFKKLNDQHGHEAGDRALALIGRIITSTIRGSDFAARYGGEEFLMLLPDTDHHGVMIVAEKLRSEIERAELPGLGSMTASLGTAVLPADAGDADGLLRKADRALYSAKEHGRNRVHAFTKSTADDAPPAGRG
jgi:diguanylate cyclase (GGDEF)-like protein